MNSKQVTYVFLAFIAILGWNAFLIQRDDKLFKAYYHQKAQVEQKQQLTAKEHFCKQQAGWHPDCNVE